jgi:alpha-1,2-mannosyltransferase
MANITVAVSRRMLRLWSVVALMLAILLNAWDVSPTGLLDRTGRLKCPDFLQFYTYGALIRTGRATALYDGEAHAQVARETIDARLQLTGFLPDYSPAVAWIMAPLSALPYLHAMTVWALATVALFGAAVWMLAGSTRIVKEDPVTLWLVAAAWPALMVVLRYGQLSAVSLALLAGAVALDGRGRRLAAGIALGCLAYKPNLLGAAAVVLVVAREWRVLWGLLISAAAQTAIALVSVGGAVFAQYLRVLLALARQPSLIQMYPTESHSLAGAVGILLPSRPVIAIANVAAIVLGSWTGARVWRSTADARVRWSALTLAMLVASPHLLTYDLLLLAVPLVLLSDWILERSGRAPRGAWLTSLLLLYAGAWPGTLVARLYGLQISTIGMGLGLALLFQQAQHQLVRREAENRVVDRPPT